MRTKPLYAFVILLFTLIVVLPKNILAAQPVASITMYDSSREANVEPGGSGIVNFSGVVEVNMIGPGQNLQSIIVHLDADSGDWPAKVIPPSIQFASAEMGIAKSFNVTVEVPLETDKKNDREMVISGTATTQPGRQTSEIDPAVVFIEIAPYSIMSFNCPEPEKRARPGEKIYYDLHIKNEGNGLFYFLFKAEKDPLFISRGGTINFTNNVVLVDRDQEKFVGLEVNIKDNAYPGTYKLKITATPYEPEQGTRGAPGECYITVKVKEISIWQRIAWYWYLLGGGLSLGILSILFVLIFIKLKGRKKKKPG